METRIEDRGATGDRQALRRLIGIIELAELWSVPKATLYNWVNQGRLPHVKLGRCLRFDVAQIEEFRQRCTISVAGKR